jgi:hypothetical protein
MNQPTCNKIPTKMKIITIIIINYSAQKSKWPLFSNLNCGGFGGNLPETQNE